MSTPLRRLQAVMTMAVIWGVPVPAQANEAGGTHAGPGADPGTGIPVFPVQVIRRLPHDPTAFTEGLLFRDGVFYESTGLSGHSFIRKVSPETGRTLGQSEIPDRHFGEGIVDWHDRLISVTWRSGNGYVWSLPGLKLRSHFHYDGEGWGLTRDAHSLILSDGTACLKRLDPETLFVVGKVCVSADGTPVNRLNELEYIHGEIWANIWMTPEIARIDPVTGQVKSWVDLTALEEEVNLSDPDAVPNGIAYDSVGDRLFVTGKYWPIVYQITIPDYKH